ncbi:hypothetical protein H5410_055650 [Solanum commersonii]|uniref:Uncharacterized protein n=1 Tax=Solanum commersonii TaxID=4109 RepID=A0A9J5WJZ1_SOLCO|nr:hypothetical protein H5410_055650 [Solanum commersonii]
MEMLASGMIIGQSKRRKIEVLDIDKLIHVIYEEMTNYIVSNISPVISFGEQDKPWWMCTPNGFFYVKISLRFIMRKKRIRRRNLRRFG